MCLFALLTKKRENNEINFYKLSKILLARKINFNLKNFSFLAFICKSEEFDTVKDDDE